MSSEEAPAQNTIALIETTLDEEPTIQSQGTRPSSFTYYHAGPLFSMGDLHANVLLSHAIHKHSASEFVPVLPQDLEQRDTTPQSIRDQDIRALLSCDLALFVYDGAELDSGTVIEYLIAKFADIPAVILRTDFRGGGDQHTEGSQGDPWNLMSSFWPRTRGVVVNAMMGYKTGLGRALASSDASVNTQAGLSVVEETAVAVVQAMNDVLNVPPRMPKEFRSSVYQWLALMAGFKDGGDGSVDIEAMLSLLKQKEGKGLL